MYLNCPVRTIKVDLDYNQELQSKYFLRYLGCNMSCMYYVVTYPGELCSFRSSHTVKINPEITVGIIEESVIRGWQVHFFSLGLKPEQPEALKILTFYTCTYYRITNMNRLGWGEICPQFAYHVISCMYYGSIQSCSVEHFEYIVNSHTNENT